MIRYVRAFAQDPELVWLTAYTAVQVALCVRLRRAAQEINMLETLYGKS
jgi:hypothetical protein